ncbi:hypothetical protein PCH_Pc22g13040 [Penicillium rubens Wisconsin 54-1255]|uniref:Uncharacterized protein n=1 Tax=Penicillium rubens (strain ATCC 28089 / DSM 1075 / NRRL 1951 / Wisconsin 54-1255) TaxID=500485 RepID=B6HSR8_PENRW|nr:hypothetical protein PCH_Pc22g13040 [Penicillium rubens Wisconsin 54-1255]
MKVGGPRGALGLKENPSALRSRADHLANPARIDYDIYYAYPIIPYFMIERTFILYNYSPSSNIDIDTLFNLAYYKFNKRISVLYNYYNSKNAIYEIFPIRILRDIRDLVYILD